MLLKTRSKSMSNDARLQSRPVGCIEILTLGALEIRLDGTALRFPGRAPLRPFNLLTALIAQGGRPVSIGALSDLLWPDADGFDAQRVFGVTLHRLRRILGSHSALRLTSGKLSLDEAICSVDAWQLERSLRRASDAESMRSALALYTGPFLGDDCESWALEARARLQSLVARAELTLMGPNATRPMAMISTYV
jgi:LuxR family maltose regulon positive regulatory protein